MNGGCMLFSIEQDHIRFKNIIKGRIKQDLRKYITNTDLILRKGKEKIAIPMPRIEIPHFKFGKNESGIGQGKGEIGDAVAKDSPDQPGAGEAGTAGNEPGEHSLEAEFTLEELAVLLGDELELPNIEPKGHNILQKDITRYKSIAHQGPNSLVNFRRSFKEAMKRQIASGTYDFKNPVIIPIKKDLRYRSWDTVQEQEASAVIIYMMDVSGSMGDEQKEIVRTESFWIDTWLRSQYKGLDTRYIIHDTVAKEVPEKTFYATKESGGTLISSAYQLCSQIVANEYPSDRWNIYLFHFSDGDNWSGEDTSLCFNLIEENFFSKVNMFGYGQVESRYGSGQFLKDLEKHFGLTHEKLILSRIENRDKIVNSIKDFLGKGK